MQLHYLLVVAVSDISDVKVMSCHPLSL